ncbi:putative chromosome segregation in meiosis protein 3 [Cladorrhinum sp. PSN259]|nr:putative chromosome segregation in meiosis protein 3 [Cladorrhinum sp. PSN259]
MAPNTTSKPTTTSREEDYLKDWDELFPSSPELAKKNDKSADKNDTSKKRKNDDDVLGLETEVDKKKQRVPRVKLDDARLLSEKGIPKLRKTAQTRLKFKGKGHEFSDAARLLSFYQEWLDDLFPKAAFLDALAMVEKAGHKTTMRNARLKWIDEGKPKSAEDLEEEQEAEFPIYTSTGGAAPKPARVAPVFEKAAAAAAAAQSKEKTPAPGNDDLFGDEEDVYGATPRANNSTEAPAQQDVPGEDDLDALMAEAEGTAPAPAKKVAPPAASRSIFGNGSKPSSSGDMPDDDDLDALMAEAEAQQPQQQTAPSKPQPPQPRTTTSIFGDGSSKAPAPAPALTRNDFGDDDDDDDLDALMAEAESFNGPSAPPTKSAEKAKRVEGDGEDDLDALMAEAEAQATSSKKTQEAPAPSFDEDEEAMAEMDGLW